MRTSIVGAANVVVDFANLTGGSYFLNGSRPPFFTTTDGFAVLSCVCATTDPPIVRAIVAIKLNRIVRSCFISVLPDQDRRCLLAGGRRRRLRTCGWRRRSLFLKLFAGNVVSSKVEASFQSL